MAVICGEGESSGGDVRCGRIRPQWNSALNCDICSQLSNEIWLLHNIGVPGTSHRPLFFANTPDMSLLCTSQSESDKGLGILVKYFLQRRMPRHCRRDRSVHFEPNDEDRCLHEDILSKEIQLSIFHSFSSSRSDRSAQIFLLKRRNHSQVFSISFMSTVILVLLLSTP